MSLLEHGKRVYLDESGVDKSDWVEVRQLSFAEVRIFRQIVREVEALPGEETSEAEGYEMARVVCEKCIIAWSEEADITPENLARLPFKLAVRVTEEAGLGDAGEEPPLPSGSTSSVSSAETVLQESPTSS